jgi:hypothetical protein
MWTKFVTQKTLKSKEEIMQGSGNRSNRSKKFHLTEEAKLVQETLRAHRQGPAAYYAHLAKTGELEAIMRDLAEAKQEVHTAPYTYASDAEFFRACGIPG